jgi:NADP-dependent 3-hydroxy acid dehydrogenase YdfG
MHDLGGKLAVVTGAAGGIGAALARALSAEGCRLALVDSSGDALLELARSLGSHASPHVMDVASADAWDELAAWALREQGGADLVVHNAGVTIHGRFASQTRADLDRIVGVNLLGVMHGCRAFLPQLTAKREAHVVIVSSLAGRVAFPYQSTYSATKFAVRGFASALRMEVRADGIGVTTVMPGAVATRLLERAHSYDATGSKKMATLMQSHGARPERVAARIVAAIRADEAEVMIGWDASATTLAHHLSPALFSRALSMGMGLFERARRG